ncbi:MAG: UDP-forming cellulose synthase catalytic subunit [Burkholderiaceae bacterium]|nr:UDP-forming cellulose synthase catalytic subunit [Burkholderiaceae bacterium]
MSLHGVLVWLAQQLQVAQPDSWGAWWMRLFFLPPLGQSPVRIDPARVPDPFVWLAGQLGVPSGAALWLWLWRLVVLPAAVPSADAAKGLAGIFYRALQGIGEIIGGVIDLLGMLLKGLTWPLRTLMARLDRLAARINTERMSEISGRWLDPLMLVPGIRWVFLVLGGISVVMAITTPLSPLGQFIFMGFWWMLSMVVRRLPGRYPSLVLATIGLVAMGRYAWWRLSNTLAFDSMIEAAFGTGLLLAEAYTWVVVVMGFIQTAWPLQRRPVDLTSARVDWPTVDVFIPTYNEPVSVLRPTVLGALALDWPKDKLRVFVLDDGRRPEMREFAESVGVGYMIRPDNNHAKAGNLNHALKFTDGELVAIFDCDHIPTRTFLTTAAGWFQRDPKCAMLQTPHHFFSPDPFERNLGTFRRVPNEGALFYGLIQDGNDFWNATFFCGSCAVLRRTVLMEVGGIAVETVTEDAHTALKMHRRGYTTAYINQTQAAGLATESLSAHVGQRIRWARGMAQIFRTDNPFLGPGLTLWQRICYANAMMHFFFGLPRLVFLTAPMTYLFFGMHIINTGAMMLALYVAPYIIQSNIANSHIQGEFRHSFWAEVYETVLAWYVALPTTVALINPKLGKFNVTAKGGLVSNPYFDWAISWPYIVLVITNLVAFLVGLGRFFIWNTHEQGTVLMNLMWTIYSVLILGASMGVAAESRQVRRMHRVTTQLPATLYLDNGLVLSVQCIDFSMTGVGLQLPAGVVVQPGEQVQVGLWMDDMECAFPAEIMPGKGQGIIGLCFTTLTRQQQIDLVQCTFARPDTWKDWNKNHDKDRPLQGLQEIAVLGVRGYVKLWDSIWQGLRHEYQTIRQKAR